MLDSLCYYLLFFIPLPGLYACLWSEANRRSRGSGTSRDELSRIISAESSSSGSRMCRPIFRYWPGLRLRCPVISAVHLRQTRTKTLLSHKLRTQNQLGSS